MGIRMEMEFKIGHRGGDGDGDGGGVGDGHADR